MGLGVFKKRYCLAGPSHVCYFKRNNLTAQPDEIIECDSIQPHPEDDRVASLQRGGLPVAWLRLLDATACDRFITAALPAIQASRTVLADPSRYAIEQQQQRAAVAEMQLQAVQAQLAQRETELASFRVRPANDSAV